MKEGIAESSPRKKRKELPIAEEEAKKEQESIQQEEEGDEDQEEEGEAQRAVIEDWHEQWKARETCLVGIIDSLRSLLTDIKYDDDGREYIAEMGVCTICYWPKEANCGCEEREDKEGEKPLEEEETTTTV